MIKEDGQMPIFFLLNIYIRSLHRGLRFSVARSMFAVVLSGEFLALVGID
jgi:hypothetical protein